MSAEQQKNWENFEKTGKISYYLAMIAEETDRNGSEEEGKDGSGE